MSRTLGTLIVEGHHNHPSPTEVTFAWRIPLSTLLLTRAIIT